MNTKFAKLFLMCKEEKFWRVGCYHFHQKGIVRQFASYTAPLSPIAASILREVYGLKAGEADVVVGSNVFHINESRPPSQAVG